MPYCAKCPTNYFQENVKSIKKEAWATSARPCFLSPDRGAPKYSRSKGDANLKYVEYYLITKSPRRWIHQEQIHAKQTRLAGMKNNVTSNMKDYLLSGTCLTNTLSPKTICRRIKTMHSWPPAQLVSTEDFATAWLRHTNRHIRCLLFLEINTRFPLPS